MHVVSTMNRGNTVACCCGGGKEKCCKIVCWFGQSLQPPANPSGQILGIKTYPNRSLEGGGGGEDSFLTASAIYYNAEEERDKKIIFISYF